MVREECSAVSGELRSEAPEVVIWEYVLVHAPSRRTVRGLTASFPFPDDVPRLKQMALIREISDILGGSKDLDIRKTLGILLALEHSFDTEAADDAGVEVEEVVSFKRLKTFRSEASKKNVKWSGFHEKTSSEPGRDAGEVVSVRKGLQQPIEELKEELRRVLERSPGEERTGKLKVIAGKLSALVKNAWALFGPTTLEKRYCSEKSKLPSHVPVASGQNVAGTAGDNEANPGNEDVSESVIQVLEARCLEIQKEVLAKSKEYQRAGQELVDVCAELRKVVKDPLSGFLRTRGDTAEVPQTPPGLSPSGEKEQTLEPPSANRSLFDRHPSAQADVWEDDDEIEEDSPSRRSPSESLHLQLPVIQSPQRPKQSPPQSETEPGLKLRRPKRKWSAEEAEVLKGAVSQFGKGNWKRILQKYKEVFTGRTEVDLKDKWRNLEKYL